MTEISSIPTYFPEIAKRSEPCRTLSRSGASLRIVYRPSEADVIIRVTSWPSEDLMAVYDGHQEPIGNFLWRVMGRDGLEYGETPLVTQFEKGFESVQKQK